MSATAGAEQVVQELHPDGRFWLEWVMTRGIHTAWASGFLAFWGLGFFGVLAHHYSFGWALVIAGAVAVGAILVSLTFARRSVKAFAYTFTDRRATFHGGWVRTVEASIPYNEISNVTRTQTAVERALGLATVLVSSSSAYLAFQGLTPTDAATVTALLNERAASVRHN